MLETVVHIVSGKILLDLAVYVEVVSSKVCEYIRCPLSVLLLPPREGL